MASPQNTHTLDMSEARYATALSWLDANREKLTHVDHEARVVAVVGLLICDEVGFVSRPALVSALGDPRAVSAANLLLNGAVN